MESVALVLGALALALAWNVVTRARGAARELQEHERRVRELRSELSAARDQLQARQATVEELTERSAQLEPLRAQLDALHRELEQQRQERESAEQRAVKLETTLHEQRARLEEQRQSLAQMKEQLADTFRALGSKALAANSEQFLQLAEQRFAKLAATQHEKSAAQEERFSAMVKPIREALARQEQAVQDLNKRNQEAYGSLAERTEQLRKTHLQLTAETGKLNSSLSRSDVRGRWGEVTLQRVVELAGMTKHCDFHTQAHCETDDGAQRPDLVVSLPGGGSIVVDAKVPLASYLALHEVDADVAACQAAHAKALRGHVKSLAAKAYWKAFERAPELVVLFIPIESALSVALQTDPSLHTDALQSRVLIATPTTLMALLVSVAHGWSQQAVAENARRIADVGKELCERIDVFVGHYAKLGSCLERAGRHFNQATGSLQSRVMVSARRLHELRGSASECASVPSTIATELRLPSGGVANDRGGGAQGAAE